MIVDNFTNNRRIKYLQGERIIFCWNKRVFNIMENNEFFSAPIDLLRRVCDPFRPNGQSNARIELRALLDAAPRCPGCGYTEQDCREQMDHHLCGLPEPAKPRPIRFADLPVVDSLDQLSLGHQIELLRDALDHIAKTCHQSRQSTRRIRWIEARANGALEGKPYDAKLIELPVEVDREIDRMRRRDSRQVARIRVLEAALQANHDWHKFYDEHDGYAESALYQTNVEALSSQAESCTWSSAEFSWSSTCGMAGWEFTDGGTPAENGMKFCHCCGKPITVAVPEDEA